uniref:Uncharacterized protein n=1 Tax=Romanomermis culicivorax TaxID=13658 RepID=A0A915L1S1_ROMCU
MKAFLLDMLYRKQRHEGELSAVYALQLSKQRNFILKHILALEIIKYRPEISSEQATLAQQALLKDP